LKVNHCLPFLCFGVDSGLRLRRSLDEADDCIRKQGCSAVCTRIFSSRLLERKLGRIHGYTAVLSLKNNDIALKRAIF
jgi:hypothetical protein